MNLTWLLDPALGNKARAILWWISSVVTVLLGAVAEVEQAGWVLTPALLVSVLGHLTSVGNKKS